jgi:hypothetical protein
MRRLAPLCCAALVSALAAAAPASALIQVDKGIAGARLKNTKAQVHAALGKPVKRQTGSNDFGAFLQETYRGGIVVFYQGAKRVTSVTTTGLGDRTAKGVGVGSTEAAVKKLVPGVTCETVAGARSCHTNDFLPGKRVTDFFLKKGKVVRVSVGIVVD